MENKKCKKCRRLGVKLFLKGERCLSPKCPIIKRPYPPGEKRKKKTGAPSEYAKELQEKQKLRNWYNLREKQFSNYVKEVLSKKGKSEDAGAMLIKKLESRLDNVVFRMGLAVSRKQARELVSHGHFLVNEKKVKTPSFLIKKGDVVSLNPLSQKKEIFKDLSAFLKKRQAPSWIKINIEKREAEIIDLPTIEQAVPPAEMSVIFEFYSR